MPDGTNSKIVLLEAARNHAWVFYAEDCSPGGLTAIGERAWNMEHFARQLLFEAAQLRLDEEIQLHTLLAAEALPHD